MSEENSMLLYFHLSDNEPAETAMLGDTPVVWKDVLVEGTYPMTPGPGGAEAKSMTVIPEGESDYATRTISMSDIEHAHEDGAFKYVTIPTRHKDEVLDNTGYVPRPEGVRRIEKNGKQVLQAALGFTEPDVKGKVERGTIPDVSAGIFFNWLNKHTKKRYPAAMKHVALTGIPFMGNLEPFKPVFAADDDIMDDVEVQHFHLADDDEANNQTQTGEIVWNEKDSFGWIRGELETALTPQRREGMPDTPQPYYWVRDISSNNTALVEEEFKGDRTRYVVPFTVEEDAVKPAPGTRWTEVREAMIAASDDRMNFSDVSMGTVLEKLGTALSDLAGDKYKVAMLTLDNRVKIVDTEDKAHFVAEFAVDTKGEIYLSQPVFWERIATQPAEEDAPEPKKSPSVTFDDTPEGNLARARARRRRLVESS